MTQNLMRRSAFAQLCGVSPGAVTLACKARLQPAIAGKRIDAAHPAAVLYRREKTYDPTAPGAEMDPLYERAVGVFLETGRHSTTAFSKALSIGTVRAKSIHNMMASTGLFDAPAPPAPPARSVELVEPTQPPQAAPMPVVPIPAVLTPPTLPTPEPTPNAVVPVAAPGGAPDPLGDLAAYADMTLREIIERFGTATHFVDHLKALNTIESIQEREIKNAQRRGELVHRDLIKAGIFEPIEIALRQLLGDGARTMAVRVSALCGAGESVDRIEGFIQEQIASFVNPMKVKMDRTLKNVGA